MKRNSILNLSLVSLVCMTAMAHGAVSVPAAGITVDFAAAPAGADFASVSVAGGGGDVAAVATLDADVTANLAWPATATNWTTNSVATEPTASNLNAQIRYAVNTARILTGPTGNKYSAFIGRFTNNAGAAIESFKLTWAEGVAVASAGTAAPGTDPIAGLSVYYSRTGTAGSWVKVSGPHAAAEVVGPATITPASAIAANSDFYIAWVDDNGPGSGTPNFEGNYTIDDVTISDITTAMSSITATVTNVTRSPGADATNPNDDLIDFTLNVGRAGNAGNTWTINTINLAATGNYTEPKVYTNLDIALFATAPHTLTGTVTDDTSGAVAEFSVTAPWSSLTASGNSFAPVAGNKFTANLNVAGTYVSTQWNTNAGAIVGLPANGAYGVNVATSEIDVPVLLADSAAPVAQVGPFTVVDSLIVDSTSPNLYLLPPMVIGMSTVPGKPAEVVSDGRFISGDANQITWGYNPAGPSLQMADGDAGGAGLAAKRISATYSLTDVNGPVQFSMKMISTDGSSGFEAADTFAARLIYSDGMQELPAVNLVTPAHEAQAGFAGVVNGILADDEIAAANTSNTFDFSAIIPDNIQSVRMEIDAIADSGYASERMVVQDILLAAAPPGVLVSNLTNIRRVENGPGSADDSVTFTADVTGINASPTWTTSAAITPNSGNYGTVNFTIPAPLPASPLVITFADGTDPALTDDLSVALPARAVIGQRDFGGGLIDVNTSLATPSSALWVNDATARTHMINAGVAAQQEVVLSEVLDLTTVGAVRLSATVTANDTSAGSNYEPTDKLKLELIIDGGLASESIVPLVGPYDVGNGATAVPFAMGEPLPNGAPDGWINGYAGTASVADGFAAAADEYLAHIERDEFNLNDQPVADSMAADLTFNSIVPEGASSVQLRLTSEGIQGTENAVLKNVLFTLSTGPVDSDSDGMDDDYETANGLLPNDASDKFLDKDGDGQSNFNEFLAGTRAGDSTSTLKITDIVPGTTAGTVNVTVATVAGKRYQLQESMDLGNGDTWADVAGAVQAATGAATTFNGVPVPFNGNARHFMRAKVVP